MARPRKVVDWVLVEKLCQILCTHEEIASMNNCSVELLQDACKRDNGVSFPEYYKQKSANGKISLRRKQWQMALAGDRVMLIWLGKQHLSQSEKIEEKVEQKVTQEVVYTAEWATQIKTDE